MTTVLSEIEAKKYLKVKTLDTIKKHSSGFYKVVKHENVHGNIGIRVVFIEKGYAGYEIYIGEAFKHFSIKYDCYLFRKYTKAVMTKKAAWELVNKMCKDYFKLFCSN